MTHEIDFAGYIKDERKRLHLSQEELASKVGVSKMTISHWERGEFVPTNGNNISSLEIALGLDTGELYKMLYGNPTPPLSEMDQGEREAV